MSPPTFATPKKTQGKQQSLSILLPQDEVEYFPLWKILINIFTVQCPYKGNEILFNLYSYAVISRANSKIFTLSFELFEISDIGCSFILFNVFNTIFNAT